MGLSINTTCNATLDDMRISSEIAIVGTMSFHTLGMIIAAACSLVAILLSCYLIWMHALHYTKPYEQRHIMRILFMVPIYSIASFLSFCFYWHTIYFQVISECYEAFAIASFFALLCHYIAPNLHDQKNYFRSIQPKQWVLPINWFAKCCGGQRSPWRTPRSGLTWFNIIFTGIYQYCFIRVTMTVTAVLTQYFGRYCESSNSPVFAHIWVLVIEGIAVSIAMYCVIQFYVQLRHDLAPHRPFLKVLAIKLVIFLSFWQSFMISILTSSTFNIVSANSKIAYPDLKVGIPSLLLCIEMAIFSVLHLFAFPWTPYSKGSEVSKYPVSGMDPDSDMNELGPKQGGFLGIKAFADAMNPWDLVKGFARGMRWLFVGRKKRENDPSYKDASFDISNPSNGNDMTLENTKITYKGTQGLPIADEFRRSKFGIPSEPMGKGKADGEEGAGLIAHAQPNPQNPGSGYVPARQRYDANGQDISPEGTRHESPYEQSPDRLIGMNPTPGTVRRQEHQVHESRGEIGMAVSGESEPYQSHVVQQLNAPKTSQGQAYLEQKRMERKQRPSPSEQWAGAQQLGRGQPPLSEDAANPHHVHHALWGGRQAPPEDYNRF